MWGVELELSPGTHPLDLRASDAAGNLGEAQVRLTVHESAPAPTVEAEFPTYSQEVVEITGRASPNAQIRLFAGTRVIAQGPFPLRAHLTPGAHDLRVAATDPRGRTAETRGRVWVDVDRPTVRLVVLTGANATTSEIQGEIFDETPVTIEVRLNDRVVGDALPLTVTLEPGENVILVSVTDAVGQTTRRRSYLPGPTQAAPPPTSPDAEWTADSGDPRELEAYTLFRQGDFRAARRELDQVLSQTRRARSPYVLRATIAVRQAERAQGLRRQQLLNGALADINAALANYGPSARADHFLLRATIQDALGRPTLAERDRDHARRLN